MDDPSIHIPGANGNRRTDDLGTKFDGDGRVDDLIIGR